MNVGFSFITNNLINLKITIHNNNVNIFFPFTNKYNIIFIIKTILWEKD